MAPDYVGVPADILDWQSVIFTASPKRATGARTIQRGNARITVGYDPVLGPLTYRDLDVFLTLCKILPARHFASAGLAELTELIRDEGNLIRSSSAELDTTFGLRSCASRSFPSPGRTLKDLMTGQSIPHLTIALLDRDPNDGGSLIVGE